MKRHAPQHGKFRALASHLKIERFAAVGLGELLWHATADQAPQGDIGRLTDDHIAELLYWPVEDAKRLVKALVKVKLLDRSTKHRLVVHDWSDHCGDETHRYLGRKCARFSDGSAPKLSKLTSGERAKAAAAYADTQESSGNPASDGDPTVLRRGDFGHALSVSISSSASSTASSALSASAPPAANGDAAANGVAAWPDEQSESRSDSLARLGREWGASEKSEQSAGRDTASDQNVRWLMQVCGLSVVEAAKVVKSLVPERMASLMNYWRELDETPSKSWAWWSSMIVKHSGPEDLTPFGVQMVESAKRTRGKPLGIAQ